MGHLSLGASAGSLDDPNSFDAANAGCRCEALERPDGSAEAR
jgi:hypothetical protein